MKFKIIAKISDLVDYDNKIDIIAAKQGFQIQKAKVWTGGRFIKRKPQSRPCDKRHPITELGKARISQRSDEIKTRYKTEIAL